jgi:hypothetical protein
MRNETKLWSIYSLSFVDLCEVLPAHGAIEFLVEPFNKTGFMKLMLASEHGYSASYIEKMLLLLIEFWQIAHEPSPRCL